MLLATTVMLLVFRAPSATISVMWLISAKMFINEKPPFPLRKFHSIANVCATLNAATTFIMFIIYGTKFRSEFTRLYCCVSLKTAKNGNATIGDEQQPMRQSSSKDPYQNQNDTERYISESKKRTTISSTTTTTTTTTHQSNGNIGKDFSRHSSSIGTSTTTPSIVSLPPLRRFNNQRRQDRLSCEQAYSPTENHRRYELASQDDQGHHRDSDRQSISFRQACCVRVTNCFGCPD